MKVRKLIVNYTPSVGYVCPDGIAEDFALHLWYLSQDPIQIRRDPIESYVHFVDDGMEIKLSSEIVVTALRALVKEKKIPHESIIFKFNGTPLSAINSDGRIKKWPKGFCDHSDRILDRLI
jgi:hypothetical protein